MSLKKSIFHQIGKILPSRNMYLTGSLFYKKDYKRLPTTGFDYIRSSTMELCFEQIVKKNLPCNVAELGVYQGDFAKRINYLFSDRILYLFDTFEGFNPNDVTIEKEKKFSPVTQDFSDTNIELVKGKMPFPEKCIFKKGYFPDSALGVDDQFCFVSIDTDLYQPIYEGLEFFYPKLVKGGYIFVHDFNNQEYPGAKQAVMEFCTKYEISFVPIADVGGTAILAK